MNNIIGTWDSYNIVETTAITKKVQRRTHKKRRINKKWMKRYGYKTVLDNEKVIIYGNSILATPKMAKKIISEVKKYEQKSTGTIR